MDGSFSEIAKQPGLDKIPVKKIESSGAGEVNLGIKPNTLVQIPYGTRKALFKGVTPDGKEVVVLYEVINIDDKGNVVNDGYIELKVEIGEFKKLNSKLVSPQTEY